MRHLSLLLPLATSVTGPTAQAVATRRASGAGPGGGAFTLDLARPFTPPECANQIDDNRNGGEDDGDGRVDYPEDPGCNGTGDEGETDPDPRPSCADGRDNDGDGRVDYPDDPDCAQAADDSEYNGRP